MDSIVYNVVAENAHETTVNYKIYNHPRRNEMIIIIKIYIMKIMCSIIVIFLCWFVVGIFFLIVVCY